MKNTVVLFAIAATAGSAYAGSFFSEVESNNTLLTANDVGTFDAPGASVVVEGVLDQGDVDWFSFTLANDAAVAFFSAFGSGDGAMQIVAAGGDVIAFDDDSGAGDMPALSISDLVAGTYYIGLSGFGDAFSSSVDSDELFDGAGHSESFGYKLTLGFTVVPAPSAIALLSMGGIVATRRRR